MTLTDGQVYWLCFAVAAMVVTGLWMVVGLCRHARAVRRHPANRPPYDWATDPGVRQPGHVRRVA